MSITAADLAMLAGAPPPQPTRRAKRVNNLHTLADLDSPAGKRARNNLRDQKTRIKMRSTAEYKAKAAAYNKEYRAKNAAKIAENKKRWTEENIDRVRVTRREWRRRHLAAMTPEQYAAEMAGLTASMARANAKLDPEERRLRRREADRRYLEKHRNDPDFKASMRARQERYQARKKAGLI